MGSIHGTVAKLDVHKKTVVTVVLRSDHPEEDQSAGVFGTTRNGLDEFLREHWSDARGDGIAAQYWRPVWMALERQFTMTLA